MNEKAVIIGAGNSGRGFIARLLCENGVNLCFVDRDEQLIGKMNTEGRFSILAGENKKETVIDGYQAYAVSDQRALEAAKEADLIFVCVGSQNLPNLKSFFVSLSSLRKAEQCKVIVCENGISPKQILRDALIGTPAEKMNITQGIIFCTSIPRKKGELDIISEEYPELPLDFDEGLFRVKLEHFPMIQGFDILMKRKLYTYNCLSACIAYMGYLKGYTDYGEAGRDAGIADFYREIQGKLDAAVCRETGVSMEEQQIFSERAVKKFTSRVITDTIAKNARAAVRKIGPEERIMGPLKLFLKNNIDPAPLCRVLAAALYYLKHEEKMEFKDKKYIDPIELFLAVNPDVEKDGVTVRYTRKYLDELDEIKKQRKVMTESQ